MSGYRSSVRITSVCSPRIHASPLFPGALISVAHPYEPPYLTRVGMTGQTISRHHETEICVIGGGPAGSTVARELASLGHDVILVERAPFPRRHIGESLSPGILPLLDLIGIRNRIEDA